MHEFKVYRRRDKGFEAQVRAAFTDWYERRGDMPSVMLLSRSDVGAHDADDVMRKLDLRVPVERRGGVLAPEIWLGREV